MELFKKLFCFHSWKTHAKKEYEWDEVKVVTGTEFWLKPITENNHISETVEVIICAHCGKVKTIKY